MLRLFVAIVALSVLAVTAAASADERGTLTGQFLFNGEPPQAEPLVLNKDQEFCGQFGLVSEELVVDPKTRGVANIVLWLDVKASSRAPEPPASGVDDSLRKSKSTAREANSPPTPRMDNAKCRFAPHIAVVQTGNKLWLGNKDPIAHAMLFFAFANDPVSLTIAASAEDDVIINFAEPEPLPVKVTCPIHAWMIGYVVVQDHPFVAVTDHEGKFRIEGLPPGEWTFRIWQEKSGYVSSVTRDGQEQKWDRGQIKVTVKPGDNSLGVLQLSPKLFAD